MAKFIQIMGLLLIILVIMGCQISGSQESECVDPNPEDFELGYVKCGSKVLYIYEDCDKYSGCQQMSKKVIGADPKTFNVLETKSDNPNNPLDYPWYGMDSKNVYFFDTEVVGADPETFKYLSHYYSLDKNNVYYQHYIDYSTSILTGADRESFEVIGCWARDYAKDKFSVYQVGIKIEGADPKTFEPISCGYYSKDKDHVYYRNELIEEGDPKTFKQTEVAVIGQDQNYVYEYGKRMSFVNP